jgi:hypothetical protein
LSLFDLLHRCQSHEAVHSETQARRQASRCEPSVVRCLGRRESRRARADRSSDKSGSRTAWRLSISFATVTRVAWPVRRSARCQAPPLPSSISRRARSVPRTGSLETVERRAGRAPTGEHAHPSSQKVAG